MSNKNTNFKDALFRLKCKGGETSLFGLNPVTKEMIGVINQSIKEDYDQKVPFKFRHPGNDLVFARHYSCKPYENYAMIHIGRFKKDYATVYINLTCVKYEPFLIIINYDAIDDDLNIVKEILERTFNWVFRDNKEQITLEEVIPFTENMKMKLLYDCFNAERNGRRKGVSSLMRVGHENLSKQLVNGKLKKKGKELKSKDFKDSILKGDKDELISLIYDLIKDKERAQYIVRPIAFLVDHGIIERPTFAAFINQFPDMKGLLVRQSFDRLIRHSSHYYGNDLRYKQLAKTFEAYM